MLTNGSVRGGSVAGTGRANFVTVKALAIRSSATWPDRPGATSGKQVTLRSDQPVCGSSSVVRTTRRTTVM
ncbi:hypothetical protein BJF82_11490 [Kytococcus sp. CUA-901]|nr:hypothetical protein BJF82_11490 [Kytococcus sp. CUA-901]